jgi:WD40 repeat protein
LAIGLEGRAVSYDAFFSYSHAADGRLAPALQSGLQRFAKPWYRPRALHVFRDETGLATNPHLWSSIQTALDESEWFVLLASREAASSPWVDREVRRWLTTKPHDHLLAVVTDGGFDWDVAAHGLIGDAVPAGLREAVHEEPRFLDLRWARSETDLDLRNSRFRSAVADLAAPMHGVAKDELESEDIRQYRRARRLARGGVTVVVILLVLSVVFGVFAATQRNRADRDARRALAAARDAELRNLVSDSRLLVAQDPQLAGLLAAEAYMRRPDSDSRDALLGAVLAEPRLQRTFGPTSGAFDLGGLIGSRVVVATPIGANATSGPYRLSVWNWRNGQQQAWPGVPATERGCSGPVGLATSADGELVAVVTADGRIQMFSGQTMLPQGAAITTGLDFTASCSAPIAFSPNGRWLAVANGSLVGTRDTYAGTTVALFEHANNAWRRGPSLRGHHIRVNSLAFSSDGTVLATGSPPGTNPNADPGLIVLHDVRTGATRSVITTSADLLSVALDWQRRRVVVGSTNSDSIVFDLNNGSQKVIAGLGTATFVGYDRDWARLGVLGTHGFRLLDAATLAPIDGPDMQPKTGNGSVLFLPDDQALTAGTLGPLTLWDLRFTSILQTVIANDASVGPSDQPDAFIAGKTTSNGTFITVLDRNYQPLSPELHVGAAQNYGPAWCTDPRTHRIATIGTGAPHHPGTIIVRSGSAPFAPITRSPGVDFVPLGCAWRPDGEQLAIGGLGGEVALYQLATATTRRVNAQIRAFALSLAYRPDSTELWVTGPANSPARVTNLDGTPKVAPAFHGRVLGALHFTPDGRFLVTVDTTSLQVLDAHTLRPVTQPIAVGSDYVYVLALSPDGRTAATADTGPFVRLVDLTDGRTIGPPLRSSTNGGVWFGRNDTTLYTSTTDGRATGWNLEATHLRDAACQLAGRNLTQTEWQQYLSWAGPRRPTCPQFPLP